MRKQMCKTVLRATTSAENLARRPWTLLVFLCSATVLLIVWSGFELVRAKILQHHDSVWYSRLRSKEQSEPLIFLYTSYHRFPDWNTSWDSVNGSNALRTLADCQTKCQFTSSPHLLKLADLVLISVAYYKLYGGKPITITYTKGDQLWAGFLWESPAYGDGYEAVDGIFDWTATYRRDSDVPVPYGAFHQVNGAQSSVALGSISESLRHKKLAVWLVSNCGPRSQRDILVKTLQRYVSVDVFGDCSRRKCPETNKLSCRDYLGQNYKFYLAFENSLCFDYVTEKFFLAYQYNMVPVTFGLADYSLYGPPGSYINAMDFDSVEDLAKYLLYLDENDHEYLKYFSWRGKYKVESYSMVQETCTICQTISDYMKRRQRNVINVKYSKQRGGMKRYPSLKKWYESFPAPQTSAFYHIGKNITLSTNEVCIDPKKSPVLAKWMRGE